MARARSYRAEYQRRLELGQQRGQTRQEARGHGRTPERPLDALRQPERHVAYIRRNFTVVAALATTPPGRRALGRVNQRRIEDGKAPIYIQEPPDPAPRTRQFTTDTLEEAEQRTAGVPFPYSAIYVWSGGVTWVIQQAESRRRRAA